MDQLSVRDFWGGWQWVVFLPLSGQVPPARVEEAGQASQVRRGATLPRGDRDQSAKERFRAASGDNADLRQVDIYVERHQADHTEEYFSLAASTVMSAGVFSWDHPSREARWTEITSIDIARSKASGHRLERQWRGGSMGLPPVELFYRRTPVLGRAKALWRRGCRAARQRKL